MKQNSNPNSRRGARLSPARRLILVNIGVIAGKSNRQIAAELGYDEGTIRRDRKTLALPATALAQVRRGAPAEPLLRAEVARVATEETRLRQAEEMHKGTHSIHLANEIIALLASYPISPADAAHVFRYVEVQSDRAGDRVPARSFSNLKSAFAKEWPSGDQPRDIGCWIDWLSKSLARAIISYEANAEIRERAIRRATEIAAMAEYKRHW
jgi:hypothetical protein